MKEITKITKVEFSEIESFNDLSPENQEIFKSFQEDEVILKNEYSFDTQEDEDNLLKKIEAYGQIIKNISNPTELMILKSLLSNKGIKNIKFITCIPQSVYNVIIDNRPDNLQFVPKKDQTLELCKRAIDLKPSTFQYIIKQNEDICMYAVQKEGLNLRFVKKQTKEICLAAIKNNPDAFRFVEDQDLELCEIAIKGKASNIEFIEEEFQTEDICLRAIMFNPNMISVLKQYHPRIINLLVKTNSVNSENIRQKCHFRDYSKN